jgi:S1-C subfamily serine protease
MWLYGARLAGIMLAIACAVSARAADVYETIARVKRSVVAVGTYQPGRSPPFQFRGTGFVVGDGNTIATNSHVLPDRLDTQHRESLAVLVPLTPPQAVSVRPVRPLTMDASMDLALLTMTGEALPPLPLHDLDGVREGQAILMTGYPIGAVLGPYAATHRGMIAAITPIAIPQASAGRLTPALVRRLKSGSFSVLQLDATAYPGNSGSPIYDPATGEVLGIVIMVLVKRTKEAALSDPSGITYAVPSTYLAELLRTSSSTKTK